jgi:hypothetical protein
MTCRHDQMLPVVCRILASLSHWWFVCVFSPVGWLQYSGNPSDTSNSFEGHPCCMHADYLPSLCFWYSSSYHAYWEWIRVTSDRDDRSLQRLIRRMPFATSPVLKQHWLPNRRLSTRTVRNRLKSAGLKSRRVIKRSLLADRHRRSRSAWCLR